MPSTANNKGGTDVNQSCTVQHDAVCTLHQFTATPTVITTHKFQDTGSQIDLEKPGHNSGRVAAISPSQYDLTNLGSTNSLNPTSASKTKTYIRVNIIPATQSIVGETSDCPRLEYTAFGIPRPRIQLIVNSRFPVNGTPRGIERRCLPCVLSSLVK